MPRMTVWSIRRFVRETIAEVLGIEMRYVHPKHALVNDLRASDTDIAEIITYLDAQLGITFPERDEGTHKTRTVERLTKRVLACYRREHGGFALDSFHKKT